MKLELGAGVPSLVQTCMYCTLLNSSSSKGDSGIVNLQLLVSSRDLNQTIFNESSLCRIRRLKATYATSVTMQSPGFYMSQYLADQRFQSGHTHTSLLS